MPSQNAEWEEGEWRIRVINDIGRCERASLSGSLWDFVKEAKERGVGESALTEVLRLGLAKQSMTESTMAVRLSEARRVMRFHGDLDTLPQNLQEAAQAIRARDKNENAAPTADRRKPSVESLRIAIREVQAAISLEDDPHQCAQLKEIVRKLKAYRASL